LAGFYGHLLCIRQDLFPNDAFGQHYASKERFADQVGMDIILGEAAKYYANIVMPYGGRYKKP